MLPLAFGIHNEQYGCDGYNMRVIIVSTETTQGFSGNPSSILGLDTMLRMASAARVYRRLRRYYLIVRLLPNVFVLACLPLGSI